MKTAGQFHRKARAIIYTRCIALFCVIIGIGGCFLYAHGQTVPVPSPTPTPIEDDEVVKISTTLIQLDVSVTDKKGKPISGLKPEDFTVYENGRKQNVSGLSFISAIRESNAGTREQRAADPLAPPPATTIRPENARRTIALVVDDLTLSFESAYHTRRALKRFLDEQMQEGDLVAIVRTSAGVGALQQFTSDRRILEAAMEKVKWNPLGSGGIGAFAPIEPTMLEQMKAMGDDSISEEDLEREKEFNQGFDDFRSSTFATGTLGALRFIVEGMSELPGRKSVVLFSDGFRMFSSNRTELAGGGMVVDFMRKLVDVANRASVVFYTIDPRGLVVTGITAADQIVDPSPERLSQILSDRSEQLFETQGALRQLAEETGGFAVINNNDIIGGVRRVMEDQSYYLLAYEPEEATFDATKLRYNRIIVKVDRPDAVVRYRSGFFNVASEDVKRPVRSNDMTPQQLVGKALTSPFALSEIDISLNALYANDGTRGNYLKPLLYINAGDLDFIKDESGKFSTEIGIIVANMDANGVIAEESGKSFTISLDENAYKRAIEQGFVYHLVFPVKKPGAYQMRVAIVDLRSRKVGSASQFIQVPDPKKKGRPSISGIVLQNFTPKEWAALPSVTQGSADPMRDTSIRRFKRGSVLQYGYEVYQAALNGAKQPMINTRVRLFKDGVLKFEGEAKMIDTKVQSDLQRLKSGGAISLAEQMEVGEYVLQIVVKDEVAKAKYATATQFVQFEVIE